MPLDSSSPPDSPVPILERLDKVCVALTGHQPEAMLTHAIRLLEEFPFQEFRLDYLADVAGGLPVLGKFLGEHPALVGLATCRPLPSGGCFHGSAKQELEVLVAAAQAGFPLVDLSLESAEELGPSALAKFREQGVAVLVSFHDFQHTGDLGAVLDRMRPLAPDIAKIVSTAQSITDSVTVLRFLETSANGLPFRIVAVAMGETGTSSRILGPRAGSVFTFAAATEAEATAPGQLTARVLTELYRARELQPATRLYGVAGDPIHSSLSPLMLNAAFRAASLDAVYLPLKTGNAEELFQVARELSLEGFSVTMPLKQAILPLLDEVAPTAAKIGAVNTVKRTPEGKFHGFNTDAAGIVDPLMTRTSLRGARVLVLGAGGAARAAVYGCLEQGAEVFLHNRTQQKAEALAQESGAHVVSRTDLAQEHFDVLINATPAGMRDNALTIPVEEAELNARIVFDLVYNPIDTPLLTLARSKGLETIPGVEMFVHQGARQFELWTGQSAPVQTMQEAVLRELQGRAAAADAAP